MRWPLIVQCLLATPVAAGSAQGTTSTTIYGASWADVAAVAVTGGTGLLPGLLKLPSRAPSCAPCSPAGLPGIDRWVVGARSSVARNGGNVLLLGVGGMTAYLTTHGRPSSQAQGNLAVLANSVSWTVASTAWLKVLVHRKRPVLYTSGAAAVAAAPDNQRSFPSGHTSVAFSVATAYLVMAQREHLPHRDRHAILLYTGAAGIGALRVAGGSHFPTDVLGGAALGTGVGWLVAVLHPRTP
ncbi:MAG TPA: phosphatase PAP2 family protein [Gemmatimonadales bacterium]|nr:phosphatase PAP2 family protein [Gemmatimonadales bacterium]